jgi:hypothetical protein
MRFARQAMATCPVNGGMAREWRDGPVIGVIGPMSHEPSHERRDGSTSDGMRTELRAVCKENGEERRDDRRLTLSHQHLVAHRRLVSSVRRKLVDQRHLLRPQHHARAELEDQNPRVDCETATAHLCARRHRRSRLDVCTRRGQLRGELVSERVHVGGGVDGCGLAVAAVRRGELHEACEAALQLARDDEGFRDELCAGDYEEKGGELAKGTCDLGVGEQRTARHARTCTEQRTA